MKAPSVSLALLLGVILSIAPNAAFAQSIDPAPDPALPYRILALEDGEIVLGLSPDGSRIVTGLTGPKAIRVRRSADFSVMAEIALPEAALFPSEKRAQWSPDGDRIVFRTFGSVPLELSRFKCACIYAIDIPSGKVIRVSDDKYKEKVSLDNLDIYFDPSFASDGKSVVFHKLQSRRTKVVSVDLKTGKERLVHLEDTRANACYAYPLAGGRLLVNRDPMMDSEPNALLIVDGEDRLTDIALESGGGEKAAYQVRDLSADLSSALVYSFAQDPERPSTLSIKRLHYLEFDGSGGSSEKEIGEPDGYRIMAGGLSPDGRSIVIVVRESEPSEGGKRLSSALRLDLETGTASTLFSDPDEDIVPGCRWYGLKSSSDGLFLSDSGLLIYCADGFRLYELP